eukprot:TRINITY_DN14334_c0_g1_i1.p1 TRINITY_DN14334_c0_g1~~TRINITY_DN14334_c0_g1_i1.p1  ORF type:complete len:240 (+),score=39.78 TRINITY_DN14334_c0_g1_i1:58-720(+)
MENGKITPNGWWYISCFMVMNAAFYYAFAKHRLPNWLAKYAARYFFWPTLPVTVAGFLTGYKGNWWDQIDDKVWLGGVPLVMLGHVDKLEKMGVKAVVNLMDEYNGPVSEYKSKGITQLIIPVIDHTEPSVDALSTAVDFIEKHRSRGEGVYIHCKAGHGRSAAVGFCWLLHSKRKTPKSTQDDINQMRDVRKKLFMQNNVNYYYKQKIKKKKKKKKKKK